MVSFVVSLPFVNNDELTSDADLSSLHTIVQRNAEDETPQFDLFKPIDEDTTDEADASSDKLISTTDDHGSYVKESGIPKTEATAPLHKVFSPIHDSSSRKETDKPDAGKNVDLFKNTPDAPDLIRPPVHIPVVKEDPSEYLKTDKPPIYQPIAKSAPKLGELSKPPVDLSKIITDEEDSKTTKQHFPIGKSIPK